MHSHSSLGTGHPGANSTLWLLKDFFWWSSMARDVKRFVQCCPDLRHFQKPLPTTNWQTPATPCVQPPMVTPTLGVDSITYLLPSDGNTCILHSRITTDLQQSEAPSYYTGQKVWPGWGLITGGKTSQIEQRTRLVLVAFAEDLCWCPARSLKGICLQGSSSWHGLCWHSGLWWWIWISTGSGWLWWNHKNETNSS